MKILIADDEHNIRELLNHYFQNNSNEILLASDGREALHLVQKTQPDLVILDVDMPQVNGHEVCAYLRRNFKTRHIPILMLTGKIGIQDKVNGLRLGADDYVTKPFHIKELEARVHGIIKRHKQTLGANPLTGLGGSPAIEEELSRRQSLGQPVGFAYVDINHFKAYNDCYGYRRGDEVIKKTANLIESCLQMRKASEPFVGHIGGDDFVIMSHAKAIGELIRKIAKKFDATSPLYYSRRHQKQGFIATKNRLGRVERFPLMSLTIAVIRARIKPAKHYAQLVDTVTELKRYAKTLSGRKGSIVLADRRQH